MSKGSDKIDAFWTWFVKNKSKFEDLFDQDSSHQDQQFDLILSHIRKIEGGLAVEITKEVGGVREIIISADGDRTKFAAVQAIVSKAPKIEGWTVTAFRQRASKSLTLQVGDIEFDPSKMYFDPLVDGDSLDVIVYIENLSKNDFNEAVYYGLMTVDNVLGEYDCVMKVRHYDFHDTEELPKKHNLKHLTELPQFVDDFHSERKK
jgi:hypothetical protein